MVSYAADSLSFREDRLPVSVEKEVEYLRSVRDDPRSVSYFAWKNGMIVGNVSLSSLPGGMAHRAELGLTVLRSKWGSGIGSALLQKAISYAKEHGIEITNLEVRSDYSSAIHIYEKSGFRRISTSPAFFKIGNSSFGFDLLYINLIWIVNSKSLETICDLKAFSYSVFSTVNDASCLITAAGIIAVEVGDHNAGGRVCGVDKFAVTDIDSGVTYVAAAGIEAQHITRLKVIDCNAVHGLV